MFGDQHLDRVRELFAAQFEDTDAGLVYRRYQKGPAIPVSADERDQFVTEFQRALRRLLWGFMALILLMIVAMVFYFAGDEETSALPLWAGMGLLIVLFLAGQFRLWDAPTRALASRLPLSAARSRQEMRRIAMERLTWRRLAAMTAAALLPIPKIAWDKPLLAGENLLWVGLMAFVLTCVAVVAIRKLTAR